MEVRLSKIEIEKIAKLHLPHTEVKKWDGKELILEVNVSKLVRTTIKGKKVFTLPNTVIQANYIICPIIKEGTPRKYLIIQ